MSSDHAESTMLTSRSARLSTHVASASPALVARPCTASGTRSEIAIRPTLARRRSEPRAPRSWPRLEQVVAHPPLLATLVAEQLGTRHEEDSPARPPLVGVLRPVGLLEDRHDGIAPHVHVLEPRIAGALVVRAVP